MLAARPRVLLADDYPDLVKAVARLLAQHCDVVGSVADGSDLLDAARRLHPDVIVLDLNLPNVNGLEACRQIRQAFPEMRVILFSAVSDAEIGEHFLTAGASAFVSKLAPVNSLLSTIQQLCG